MEQITASIAKHILSAIGDDVTPYYNELKQNFKVPSVFFPELEVGEGVESLDRYGLEHSWGITFFHSTTGGAYELAKVALKKITGGRYYVPIVNFDGNDTGKKIRILRATVKKADEGVCLMWLDWTESYEYDDLSEQPVKMQTYDISVNTK